MTAAPEVIVPIVFIHGWKASVLIDKNTHEEKFNYAFCHLLGLDGPTLDLPMEWEQQHQAYDDMIASHPCRDVSCLCGTIKLAQLYGPLLNHLKTQRSGSGSGPDNNVHTFAYDWRRELSETSTNFEIYLEGIQSQYNGITPQVIGHSMGCLITLHVLNRRPDLFHSVLFGAGAMAPSFTLTEDMSLRGGVNTIVRNTTMFTPAQHLTNPGATHMMIAYPGERTKFGKEHTTMIRTVAGGKPYNDTEYDLNKLDTWKELQIGMYHPNSGVTLTPAKETWFQSVLNKCYTFRKGLIPTKPEEEYPPVAVLHSDGLPTKFGFHLDSNGHVDFDKPIMLPGDGRVMVEDSVPPKGVPVVKVITNKEEHTVVLNDLEAVDELLGCLMEEAEKKKKK